MLKNDFFDKSQYSGKSEGSNMMKSEKIMSLEEFIQDGYLLKSLDLPEETCQQILGST
jgi:hypothetical protein